MEATLLRVLVSILKPSQLLSCITPIFRRCLASKLASLNCIQPVRPTPSYVWNWIFPGLPRGRLYLSRCRADRKQYGDPWTKNRQQPVARQQASLQIATASHTDTAYCHWTGVAVVSPRSKHSVHSVMLAVGNPARVVGVSCQCAQGFAPPACPDRMGERY